MVKPTPIDKEWFFARIDDKRSSLRKLAAHLEIDPSSASRMFDGKRRMTMQEATQIAAFLGAPVNEVMRHAGIEVESDRPRHKIVLAAVIIETGYIERLHSPKPLPPAVVERAQAAVLACEGVVIAAQIRASSGPLALFDDAVVLFQTATMVEPGAMGTIAICRLHKGDQILAKIESARKTGEARVRTIDGKTREVELQNATPVLAIIP